MLLNPYFRRRQCLPTARGAAGCRRDAYFYLRRRLADVWNETLPGPFACARLCGVGRILPRFSLGVGSYFMLTHHPQTVCACCRVWLQRIISFAPSFGARLNVKLAGTCVCARACVCLYCHCRSCLQFRRHISSCLQRCGFRFTSPPRSLCRNHDLCSVHVAFLVDTQVVSPPLEIIREGSHHFLDLGVSDRGESFRWPASPFLDSQHQRHAGGV